VVQTATPPELVSRLIAKKCSYRSRLTRSMVDTTTKGTEKQRDYEFC